jgi:amino acid permease
MPFIQSSTIKSKSSTRVDSSVDLSAYLVFVFIYLFLTSHGRLHSVDFSALQRILSPLTRSISAMIASIKSHSFTPILFTSQRTRIALDAHHLAKPCLHKLALILFALWPISTALKAILSI